MVWSMPEREEGIDLSGRLTIQSCSLGQDSCLTIELLSVGLREKDDINTSVWLLEACMNSRSSRVELDCSKLCRLLSYSEVSIYSYIAVSEGLGKAVPG